MNLITHSDSSFDDIRLRGIYTGFSPGLTTNLTFGVKFPSGDYQDDYFDRDLQIGTGSTDLLLGAASQLNLVGTEVGVWNYSERAGRACRFSSRRIIVRAMS